MLTRAWNAIVRRAWYAAHCPPDFPLRQIIQRSN